jgi:hypothetical protein
MDCRRERGLIDLFGLIDSARRETRGACRVQPPSKLVSLVGDYVALDGRARARLVGRDHHAHLVPLGVGVLHVSECGLRRSIGSGSGPLSGRWWGLDGGWLTFWDVRDAPLFP